MNFYHPLLFVALAFFTGAFISAYSIPVIIKVSRRKGLLDVPDHDRKVHNNPIPALGGVAVFLGFLLAFLIWSGIYFPTFGVYLVSALLVLFSVGVKDDILVTDARKKLAFQFIAAAILVFGGGVQLSHLDGLFGVESAPIIGALLLSGLAIVTVINAYNFIDGVDGLAGTLALIASLVFLLWFSVNHHWSDALIAASLSGALIGFLFHNKEPARIFMGDTGSLTIGLTLAVMAFRSIKLNDVSEVIYFKTPTIFAFSLMMIPLFDLLRVVVIRAGKKKSPIKPDKRHLHHCLLKMGFSHNGVCLILGGLTVVIAFISFILNFLNGYLNLLVLFLVAAATMPISWVVLQIKIRARGQSQSTSFTWSKFKKEVVQQFIYGCPDDHHD